MFKQIFHAGSLTDAYKDNPEGDLGQLRLEADGTLYRFVKNACDETIFPGYVVYHGTNDLTHGEVYKMGQSGKGTSLGFGAGVAQGTIAPSNIANSKMFGWVQIGGYATKVLTLSTTTAIALGSTLIGVTGQFYVTHGAVAGTAALYQAGIMALEAQATTVTIATNIKGLLNFYR